jgi:hypothetical protein
MKLKAVLDEQVSKNMRRVKIGVQYYIFNTVLFGVGMLLLLFFAVGIMMYYGMDKTNKIYIRCPSDSKTMCENPVYQSEFCYKNLPSSICSQELLPIGFVYGSPAPPIYSQFTNIVLVYILLLFVVNHYKHNHDFRFKKLKTDLNTEEEK